MVGVEGQTLHVQGREHVVDKVTELAALLRSDESFVFGQSLDQSGQLGRRGRRLAVLDDFSQRQLTRHAIMASSLKTRPGAGTSWLRRSRS